LLSLGSPRIHRLEICHIGKPDRGMQQLLRRRTGLCQRANVVDKALGGNARSKGATAFSAAGLTLSSHAERIDPALT